MASVQRPDLSLTYGVLEIGMALAMFLTGIATLQMWNYLNTYFQDPKMLLFTVTFVFIMDSIHSVFLLHASFHYLVKSFGDYEELNILLWSVQACVIMNGIIAFAVQTFYCLRVHRLLQNSAISLFCWVLVVARLVCNLAEGATLVKSGQWEVVKSYALKWQLTATLAIGAASDIIIAGCICIGLLRHRSGFSSTDRLVDKLVAYTVGSGLLTGVVAIVEIILYLSMENFAFLAPFSVVAKLFSNSLLASLNEREHNRSVVATLSSRAARVDTRVTIDLPRSASGGTDLELMPRVDDSRSLDNGMYKS